MNNSLQPLIIRSHRKAYDEFIDQRDKDLCKLVEEYGLTVTVKMTGWSKPTVITALRRFQPGLLRRP